MPSAIFQFIEETAGQTTRWWPSARRELKVMTQIPPALRARLGQRMSPWIWAADAEGENELDFGGFGVVAAYAGAALSEKTFANGLRPGRTVAQLDGEIRDVRNLEKEFRAKIAVSNVQRTWTSWAGRQ